MNTIKLTNGTDLKGITTQNKWVLVKFSAVWCESCRQLAPIFDTVAAQHPELQALTVNVDLQSTLVNDYSVRSVTTLLFFNRGLLVSRLLGIQTEIQLNAWVEQNIQPIQQLRRINS